MKTPESSTFKKLILAANPHQSFWLHWFLKFTVWARCLFWWNSMNATNYLHTDHRTQMKRNIYIRISIEYFFPPDSDSIKAWPRTFWVNALNDSVCLKSLANIKLIIKKIKAIWIHRLLYIKENFILVITKSCEVNTTTQTRKCKENTDTY